MSLEAVIYNEARKAASGTQLWVSGMTVAKWQEVRSPLDGEVYRRKTATGGGTTDPADDVTNYIAVSYARISALSSAVIGPVNIGATAANYFAMGTTRPALPAAATGVRTLALSLTGRGNVGFVGMHRYGAGNARVEIIVDGRTVLDSTNAFTSPQDCAVYFGAAASGKVLGSDTMLHLTVPDAAGLQFRRTFQVYVTPVTGTLTTSDFLAYKMRSEA